MQREKRKKNTLPTFYAIFTASEKRSVQKTLKKKVLTQGMHIPDKILKTHTLLSPKSLIFLFLMEVSSSPLFALQTQLVTHQDLKLHLLWEAFPTYSHPDMVPASVSLQNFS